MMRLPFMAAALALVPSLALADVKPLHEAPARTEPILVYHAKLADIAPGTVEPLFDPAELTFAPPGCAPDRKARVHGLLVGASEPGPGSMRLRGPENDVRLMATALEASGAAADDIHALVGDGADRHGLRAAALAIASALDCGDRVVIYFGGQSGTPDASIISDAVAAVRPMAGGTPLQNALIYAETEAGRRAADAIHWHRKSGLILFLNGEGALERHPQTDGIELSGFEVFTAADLAQMMTAFRNRGADVAAIIDTNFASEAGLMMRQRNASTVPWRADIVAPAPPENGLTPFDALPLAADAGQFAVFYSSIGQSASVEMGFGEGGERTYFGEFTFRLANALQNRAHPTVRGLADSLKQVAATPDPRSDRPVGHRVEATDPDMPIFADVAARPPRSKAIRILRPTPKRGAAMVEHPEVEIAGRVEWPSPARLVLVQGKQAQLDGRGEFTHTVALNSGLNEVEVIALTADGRTHDDRIEFMFQGDRKALEGEGRRFAVIIANQTYGQRTGFSHLQTPFADAQALAAILTGRYGFETEAKLPDGRTVPLVVRDATARDIQTVLHHVSLVAGEKDSVLIYYAGHGIYESVTTTAFWVPVDAEAGVPFSYLSASTISEQLQRMVAGNIIMISDSCYSGALMRGGGDSPMAQLTEQDRTQALLRLAKRRSRILISSGGNEPVEDLGGDGHSVFARALITGLSEMEPDAFSARELFEGYILPMVVGRSDQEPQYRPIEKSGHDGGDIVFVRQEAAASADAR